MPAKRTFFSSPLSPLLQNKSRKFWEVVNGKPKQDIRLFDETGNVIPSDMCCVALHKVFKHSFSNDQSFSSPVFNNPLFPTMDPVIIDWVGITKLIENLKISAPGTDEITAQFLKCTVTHSSIILSKLFKQSLDCGVLPNDRKAGKVVPIPKQGNPFMRYQLQTHFIDQHSQETSSTHHLL